MKIRGLLSVITTAAIAVPAIVPYAAFSTLAVSDNVTAVGFAATAKETSTLSYKKYADHAEIISCHTDATEVVIPESIDGLPVTSIGGYAFYACSKLKSVSIPDSITNIGPFSFYKCASLESVKIPSSVKSIGNGAFYCCSDLRSIVLPDSVTDIAEIAFYGCPKLISVTVMNPKCHIALSNVTFSNGYGYVPEKEKYDNYFIGTIYGYTDSTAELFADEYGYKFEPLDNLTEPKYSLGDLDGDGKINSSDATLILVAYSALATDSDTGLTDKQLEFADVNKDGVIDASDASAVLVYYSYASTGGTMSISEYYAPKKN